MLQFTLSEDKKYYIVIGCDKDAVSVEIPAEYNGLPVKEIGERAFYEHTVMTEIIIPNSVKKIGYSAFYDCSSLTNVTIGDSVISIGIYAFYSCYSLTNVNYTGSIDEWVQISFSDYSSNPTCYTNNLYINDELVTEANITTATKINAYAFYACSSLTSVTIGDSVTSICYGAFEYCSSLTNVIIGDGVISIGNYAFAHCSKLTSIEIPNSVTSIGYGAFYDCSSLTNVIIGDGVTSIGNYAFYACDGLTSATIPVSVKSIEGRAFLSCPLQEVEFVNYLGWQVEIPKNGKKPKIKKIDEKFLMDKVKSVELLNEYSNAKWINTLDLSKMKKF